MSHLRSTVLVLTGVFLWLAALFAVDPFEQVNTVLAIWMADDAGLEFITPAPNDRVDAALHHTVRVDGSAPAAPHLRDRIVRVVRRGIRHSNGGTVIAKAEVAVFD